VYKGCLEELRGPGLRIASASPCGLVVSYTGPPAETRARN
jgi:hypothetical protein